MLRRALPRRRVGPARLRHVVQPRGASGPAGGRRRSPRAPRPPRRRSARTSSANRWAAGPCSGSRCAHPNESLACPRGHHGRDRDRRRHRARCRRRRDGPEPGVIGAHRAVGPALEPTQGFLYQQLGGFRTQIDETDMIGKLFGTAIRWTGWRAGMPVAVRRRSRRRPDPARRDPRGRGRLQGRARRRDRRGPVTPPTSSNHEAWNAAVLDFLASTTRR